MLRWLLAIVAFVSAATCNAARALAPRHQHVFEFDGEVIENDLVHPEGIID